MGAPARFVGRADELAILRSVFTRAAADSETRRGAVVSIVGEPGIGKTALVEQATAGRQTVWARAREGGGAPPMWLWEQVTRELGQPSTDAGGAGDSGADRYRMFDALARGLVDTHSHQAVVIVLDDVQWADEESLAFVDFLAPDAEQSGLVVLATVRRGELVPLPRSTVVIGLDGLTPDDVGSLLTTPDDTHVDPDLVAAVWRHTAGNPFFIGEVDKLLRVAGRENDPAQWRSIVPDGVRAVLVRRFARLPQRSNHTMLAAAELGEVIDPPILAAALELPVDDVLDHLTAAADASLLRATSDAGFRFGHSLVREAARAELPARERRLLNLRAAAALEARLGDRAVGQIARHLLVAGDPAAGSWAERAGDAAYEASMYAEAAAWFERAIECEPGTSPPLLRLRRAEAVSRCGRTDEADAEFIAVARIARTSGDGDLLARAALGVGSIGGGFEVRQLDPAQQAMVSDAIEQLDGTDSPLLATLMARLSIARSLDADHGGRADLAIDALAMARRTGDDRAIGVALGAWCDAHAGPADIDARGEASMEMLTVAQRCGDVELEMLARRLALVAALEAADLGLVRRHAAAFAGLADRLRLPQFTWYARLVEGMLALLAGDLDRAATKAAEAAELGRQAHSANAHMLADGALAPAVDRDRGDPGYLDRLIRVNTGIPEATRGHDLTAPFHLYTVGYGGTVDEVATGLPEWAEMWRSAGPHDGLTLFLGFHLARGAAFAGDAELIASTESALEPYAERLALDGTGSVCYGPVSAALAALAAARGDTVLAERRYHQAISTCRRIGAPLLQRSFERELDELGRHASAGHHQRVRYGTLRRDGDTWLVQFDGLETRLKHTKGLGDLAVLIARPDRDVHVFDLVGASGADRSDAGSTIDAEARAAYERHIVDLTRQIESAEEAGKDDRAASLDDERAALISHLGAALGLGGRPRVAASDVERARKAVGMRVRDACRRIDAELPDLGRHLHNAVRTGTWCSYRPDTPTEWNVDATWHRQTPSGTSGA